MVRGLVENQQVWFGKQCACNGNAFALSAGHCLHVLIWVVNPQLAKRLFGKGFEFPFFESAMTMIVGRGYGMECCVVLLEYWQLRKVFETCFVVKGNLAGIGLIESCYNAQKRRLTGSIATNDAYTFAILHTKRYVLEENLLVVYLGDFCC